MSSSAEMTSLVREVAGLSTPSQNWKERVRAAAHVLKLSFSRAKAHYYGEARRVDAGEMDRARAAARELRENQRRQRDLDHINWLRSQIERLRASGEGPRGPHVDEFEHLVRLVGDIDGAMEVPGSAPDSMPAAVAAEI